MTKKERIYRAMRKACKDSPVELKFLWSLIKLESDFNIHSMRYEPSYEWYYKYPPLDVKMSGATLIHSQKISYGLCHVMGAHYYAFEHKGFCSELFKIDLNLEIAVKILEGRRKKYGSNPLDLYAAFNAWTVKKKKNGLYVNELNVRAFEMIYENVSMDTMYELLNI